LFGEVVGSLIFAWWQNVGEAVVGGVGDFFGARAREAKGLRTRRAVSIFCGFMAGTGMDIKYVAHLARLALTPEEEEKLSGQLGNILHYIEKLNQLDVSNVEPTSHAVPLVNVTREDAVRPSLPNEEALRNAPAKANGLFLVPKIVE
jgi:aspartyl-tRNA(Asn)/glutamyl-tRNA(Gln) amidotransferase subunit C